MNNEDIKNLLTIWHRLIFVIPIEIILKLFGYEYTLSVKLHVEKRGKKL